jgi:hypothetical protein
MEIQKQEATLQWYIDLINADLNQLSMGDKMKLIGDAITIIDEKTPVPFKKDGVALLPYDKSSGDDRDLVGADEWGDRVGIWLKEDKLAICQNTIKSCFLDMMQIFNNARDQIKEIGIDFFKQRNSLPLYQTNFKNVYIKVELPIIEPELNLTEVSPEQLKKKKVKTSTYDTETQILLEEFDKTSPNVSHMTETDEITLLNFFIMEIQQASLVFFKKCIECGNWYIHKSKRKRLFCSPQCAMRKANRDKRKSIKDQDPDKYKKELAAGRKRAKKSYRKRTEK